MAELSTKHRLYLVRCKLKVKDSIMKKIRFGVLGTGFMGKLHAKNIRANENAQLAAVCDMDGKAAEKLALESGVGTKVFTDFDMMLKKIPLDAICVCLPPFVHDGQVEKATAKGIHIFLEKPIALNSGKARKMTEAVEKSVVVSQVGFHFRFKKGVRKMKQMIDDGSAGTPTLFDARYWCDMEGGPWWRDREKSGGQVVEQLIHLYDLSRFLFGKPQSVSGRVANLCHSSQKDYSIEDTSIGQIRFESGALASITGSNCALPVHFIGDWRIVCEKALLDTRSTGQSWVTPDKTTIHFKNGQNLTEETFTEDNDPYKEEMDAFITAIMNGTKSPVPIREGLESQILAESVLKSSEKGGSVVIL